MRREVQDPCLGHAHRRVTCSRGRRCIGLDERGSHARRSAMSWWCRHWCLHRLSSDVLLGRSVDWLAPELVVRQGLVNVATTSFPRRCPSWVARTSSSSPSPFETDPQGRSHASVESGIRARRPPWGRLRRVGSPWCVPKRWGKEKKKLNSAVCDIQLRSTKLELAASSRVTWPQLTPRGSRPLSSLRAQCPLRASGGPSSR